MSVPRACTIQEAEDEMERRHFQQIVEDKAARSQGLAAGRQALMRKIQNTQKEQLTQQAALKARCPAAPPLHSGLPLLQKLNYAVFRISKSLSKESFLGWIIPLSLSLSG